MNGEPMRFLPDTLTAAPPPERWDSWVEYDAKAWPTPVSRHFQLVPTTCFNCEANCGLVAWIDKETGEIHKLEGNPHHPASRGRNCAKGPATLNQVHDPERILHPLRRSGPRGSGQWERVSWDDALDDIGGRIGRAFREGISIGDASIPSNAQGLALALLCRLSGYGPTVNLAPLAAFGPDGEHLIALLQAEPAATPSARDLSRPVQAALRAVTLNEHLALNELLRTALTEAALGAIRHGRGALATRYRRIMRHRGHKKAVIAVAHAILVVVYHLLTRQTTYHELGDDYYDRRHAERSKRRALETLERQGYRVVLEPAASRVTF